MRSNFFLLSMVLLGTAAMAHLGSAEDRPAPPLSVADRTESPGAPPAADTRKQASRLLLEFRFREIGKKLDSLWEDSLWVPTEELKQFRRAMHTAAKVLAEAKGRLGELKRTESGSEPRKWESLRSQLERTLFGLDRYLADTEAYWLPAGNPISPSDPGKGEKDL